MNMWGFVVIFGMILIIAVGLWIIPKQMQNKKTGFPIKDKRTTKLEGYAARYTFIISLYFMVGLLHYTVFGVGFLGLPELKALPALLLSITVMIALYLGLRWHSNKKEDIE